MAKAAAKKPRKKSTRKGGTSKSQQARDYKASHPTASTQAIADALKMSYNAVYQAVKPTKTSKKKGKRGRPKGSSNGHAKSPSAMGGFEHFFSAVADVGLTKAREFLDRLEKMRK